MKKFSNIEARDFCLRNNINTEFFKFRTYNNYVLVAQIDKNIFEYNELGETPMLEAMKKGYEFFFIAEKDIQQIEERIIIKDKSASRLYLQQQKPIYDMSYSFAETSLKMPSWVRKHLDIWCILMYTKRKGVYLNVSLNPWIPDQYVKSPIQAEDLAHSNSKKFIFAKRADIENPFFKIEDYPDPYEPDKRNKEVYEYCHIRKGAKVKHLCSEK